MLDFILQYFAIFIFLAVALGLSVVLLIIPLIIAPKKAYKEKNTTYECGFDPEDDNISKFDIRFCLVGILFTIFDLELAFIFPWTLIFDELNNVAFWSMILFLAILAVGFVYEWKKDALEWY